MGPFLIQELSDSLVIIRPRRNGCAAQFLLLWLTLWTYGLVKLAAQQWPASWNVLVPMGLAEVVVLAFFLYSLVGQERLTIGRHDITYEHSAIVTFNRRTIQNERIASVDLLPLDPATRKDRAVGVLVVTADDREIRFGAGLSGLELHELLSRIRQRLELQRAKLPPVVSAAKVAPISHSQREEQDEKARSLPSQIAQWLTVPFFILAGCGFVVGGVSAILTGRPLNIRFGLFFLCIGLLLSIGLIWASLAVFLDWLRRPRNRPP